MCVCVGSVLGLCCVHFSQVSDLFVACVVVRDRFVAPSSTLRPPYYCVSSSHAHTLCCCTQKNQPRFIKSEIYYFQLCLQASFQTTLFQVILTNFAVLTEPKTRGENQVFGI